MHGHVVIPLFDRPNRQCGSAVAPCTLHLAPVVGGGGRGGGEGGGLAGGLLWWDPVSSCLLFDAESEANRSMV